MFLTNYKFTLCDSVELLIDLLYFLLELLHLVCQFYINIDKFMRNIHTKTAVPKLQFNHTKRTFKYPSITRNIEMNKIDVVMTPYVPNRKRQ